MLALAHSSHRPGVILASGASGQLVSLSMETGEVVATSHASKHPISCLAVSSGAAPCTPNSTVVSGRAGGYLCETRADHAEGGFLCAADASHVFGGGTTLSLWQQSGQQCERAGKYTGHTVSEEVTATPHL